MSDPLKRLLELQTDASQIFPPGSRYHGTDTASREGADGETVVYLRRRFVPPPESLATLRHHKVESGDRLDNLAAAFLGDPELFWRLADANRALHPEELTERVGRRLRITLPEGVPGGISG